METDKENQVNRRIITVLSVAAVTMVLALGASAGGYQHPPTTTTTTIEDTTTTQPEEVTTTWGAGTTTTTSTTISSTTTSTTIPTDTTSTTAPPSSTTTSGPDDTTSIPAARPAEWSWSIECGIVFVDFGYAIDAVELVVAGDFTAFYRFEYPGAYGVLVAEPTLIDIVPIADGNHFPVPDSARVLIEPCSVVPPPDTPTSVTPLPTLVPDDPTTTAAEELPLTGTNENLALAAIALLAIGGVTVLSARGDKR